MLAIILFFAMILGMVAIVERVRERIVNKRPIIPLFIRASVATAVVLVGLMAINMAPYIVVASTK
jgi:uncharacterized membrane protein